MNFISHFEKYVAQQFESEMYLFKKGYLDDKTAVELFNEYRLLDIPQRHIKMFNRVIPNPRLIGIFSDDEFVKAPYGCEQHVDGPLTPSMKFILAKVNHDYNQKYNAIVVNNYRSGSDYIGWHKDREMKTNIVCTLSLGASRIFQLRNDKTRVVDSFHVESGDIFVLLPECQKQTKHRVKKEPSRNDQRISLTFRII